MSSPSSKSKVEIAARNKLIELEQIDKVEQEIKYLYNKRKGIQNTLIDNEKQINELCGHYLDNLQTAQTESKFSPDKPEGY